MHKTLLCPLKGAGVERVSSPADLACDEGECAWWVPEEDTGYGKCAVAAIGGVADDAYLAGLRVKVEQIG